MVAVHLASPVVTRRFGRVLAGLLRPPAVVTLHGELGTGKTTLVRAALRALGARGAITSPSFTMAQSYVGRGGTRLHHLDLYRLSPGDDAALFAWSDYLDGESIVFVEWPEAATMELPAADLGVSLAHETLTSRNASVLARSALTSELMAGLAGAGISATVTSEAPAQAGEAS
jgi:tRNA threonylcarbamoyladenosine biosynthesis protein TsaE